MCGVVCGTHESRTELTAKRTKNQLLNHAKGAIQARSGTERAKPGVRRSGNGCALKAREGKADQFFLRNPAVGQTMQA